MGIPLGVYDRDVSVMTNFDEVQSVVKCRESKWGITVSDIENDISSVFTIETPTFNYRVRGEFPSGRGARIEKVNEDGQALSATSFDTYDAARWGVKMIVEAASATPSK